MQNNIFQKYLKHNGEMTEYGFNLLIKSYAKFPKYIPISFHIEHGWTALSEPLVSDLRTNKKLMLVFSKRREKAWKEKSDIPVVIMGSPFIHYRRTHKIERYPDAKGTIVYPSHSGTYVKATYDVEKYCKQLQSLDDEFKPITISLHNDDIRRGLDKEFAKYGFNIVTSGHRDDVNFAKKFYNILRHYKYSTSNEINSATFYCVEMEIPFFILGDIPYGVNDGRDMNVPMKVSILDFEQVRIAYKMFNTGPVKSISEEQKEYVYREMGVKNCISPQELKKLFWKIFDLKDIVTKILNKISKIFKFINYKIAVKKARRGKKISFVCPIHWINDHKTKTNKYIFSNMTKTPVLYSLIYAIMTGDLLSKKNIDESEKINYINSFQDEGDGLFKDNDLESSDAVELDWWGWRHLAVHLISALTALDSKTKYPFKFLNFLYSKGNTRKWLESLNWTDGSSHTSNAVMNYGACLQYNRDFWGISEANDSLLEMFDFLDEIQDKKTGLWGGPFKSNQNKLSQMQQTAYHLWILYFYDMRSINYMKNAIDSCLELQNEYGGFGPGHNIGRASNPFSSACEDIDCIDPLARFYFMINYRKRDIEVSLRKTIPWILYNQNKDSGFVFRREEKLVYGHQLMMSKKNKSNMFATWFRTLSLAYISKVLPKESIFNDIKFNLNNKCPGYQFWKQ